MRRCTVAIVANATSDGLEILKYGRANHARNHGLSYRFNADRSTLQLGVLIDERNPSLSRRPDKSEELLLAVLIPAENETVAFGEVGYLVGLLQYPRLEGCTVTLSAWFRLTSEVWKP